MTSTSKTTMSAQLSATSRLIPLGELRAWLDDRGREFPGDATVSVTTGSDQREGDWFRLTVTHTK